MYRIEVTKLKNPHISLKLNLKEEQKYVKQGRIYTSTIRELETAMWFVYEGGFDNVHKRLGIFSACERDILRTAQELAKKLDRFRAFTKELLKTEMTGQKAEVLEESAKAGENVLRYSYSFWDERENLSKRVVAFLSDAADGRAQLKDACEELDIKKLLKTISASYKKMAEIMDNTLRELESVEVEFFSKKFDRRSGSYQEKAVSLIRDPHENLCGCDREGVLFAALKECAAGTKNGSLKAADILGKALARYERVEKQAAGKRKGRISWQRENPRENIKEKPPPRPSVRKKMEVMRMQKSEIHGKVAEKTIGR